MTYLLAKYTLLFLFAATLSFLLGRWWTRRQFVDVTESYELMDSARQEDENLWLKLSSRIDSLTGGIGDSLRSELANQIPASTESQEWSAVDNRITEI